jgi:hypothetical protein
MSVEATVGASRRWLLIGAVVLIPVTLGALATIVLYATRAQPPPSLPQALVQQPAVVAADTETRDGSILIIQPRGAQQVRIPVGQVLEIVLQSGPEQTVVSNTPATLAPVLATPPCHVLSICAAPGAQAWTFHAVHAGVVYLTIAFGRHCSATTGLCDSVHVVLLKPFAVYSRPQAQ